MSKQDIKAGGAFVELAVKDEGFAKKFAKAKDSLMTFAASVVSVRGVVDGVKGAFNAMTAPVKDFMAVGAELDKMSKRTGASVEALSALQHAAGRTGVEFSAVEGALKHLVSRRIDPSQFEEMAKAVAEIEDPIQRAQAAQRAFGESGQALLPMLGSMELLTQEARDLGLVMSGESATSARRLSDMFANLWATIQAGLRVIGDVVAAVITPVMGPLQAIATFAVNAFKTMAAGGQERVDAVTGYIGAAWQRAYDFAAPLIGAYKVAAIDAFTAVSDVVGPVFTNIQNTVSGAWQVVSDATGQAMGWLQDTVLTALQAVSFGWQNWRTVLNTAVVGGELAVVRFANQTVHFFSEVLPTWLSWFGDNWRDVFTDIANITATIAGNIWENLKELWDAIKGLFSGEGFSFEWTPLTEGFESAIKELPKIAEREMGPLEASLQAELDGLGAKLKTEWQQHSRDFKQRAAEFQPANIADAIRKAQSDAQQRSDQLAAATPNAKAMASNIMGSFSAAALVAQGQGGGKSDGQLIRQTIRESDQKRAEETQKLIYAFNSSQALLP